MKNLDIVQRIAMASGSVILIMLATGCSSSTGPDLQAIHPPGSSNNDTGFCSSIQSEPALSILVKNFGNRDAASSVTTIKFDTGQSFDLPTSALTASSSTLLSFPIPANSPAIFHPDASFTITVDSRDQIAEKLENNNVSTGTCIG